MADGVLKGMAVITGDGIVGKVLDSFPTASQVQLITDRQFGAGVVSQTNHVYGTLEGRGDNRCKIDRVQNEEQVDLDEMFYSTGEDRVFPKGLPVGRVVSVQKGPTFKLIEVVPTSIKNGLEEVLIVLEGVHQEIPPPPSLAERISLMPPPKPSAVDGGGSTIPAGTPSTGVLATDADRVADRYRAVEQQRGAKFGAFGSQAPSFTTIPTQPSDKRAAPVPATIPPPRPAPEKKPEQQ
jgi:rod shape-determining protein MreC